MGHITGRWWRRWRWRCTVHRERGTSQGFTTTSSLSPPVCWNLPCCAMGGENLHSCTCTCTRLLCICNYACTLEVQVEPTSLSSLVCWKPCCAMGGRDLMQYNNATMLCICNGRRCGFATMGLQQTPTVIQCHPSISDEGARLAIYNAVQCNAM